MLLEKGKSAQVAGMVTGYQMVEAGLATHLISANKLQEVEEQLVEAGAKAADANVIERILSSFQAGHTWCNLL